MEILHRGFILLKFRWFSKVFFMECFTLFVKNAYFWKKTYSAKLSV